MTQNGFRPGGEHRRHPPTLFWHQAMAHRVNAGMQPMQAFTRQTVLYGVFSKPKVQQLPPLDHSVLPPRQLSYVFLFNLSLSRVETDSAGMHPRLLGNLARVARGL